MQVFSPRGPLQVRKPLFFLSKGQWEVNKNLRKNNTKLSETRGYT